MTRRILVATACSIALAGMCLPSIDAIQPGKPPRGARVAVVAFHDSRLLTLCPVVGKYVVESSALTSRMTAKAAVNYPPTGAQAIMLNLDDTYRGMFMLPMPAGRASSPGAPQDLDRLARDLAVEARLAGEFRARKAYIVVDVPAQADFVFVAESIYVPLAAGTGDPPPPRADPRRNSPGRIFSDTENEWARRKDPDMDRTGNPPTPQAPPPSLPVLRTVLGGDRHPNWRQSILGIVVPATVYLQHAGDGTALTAASLWNGIVAAGWRPRNGDSRTHWAAAPEVLVEQFHARGSGLPDYLPACAATAGVILSIDDIGEAVPARAALAESERPASGRATASTRLRSNITLVTVPVAVADRGGQAVRNLPVSAFHVFEDDVEQTVERLEPGAAPSDVALVIDASASMREVRDRIPASAQAFAGALRAADRAMVVSVGSRIRLLADLTSDRMQLQRAFEQVGPGGATRLYDALALVAVDRLRGMEGRKAVVLLTDGIDTQSQLTDDEGALAAIESLNAPVYIIRFETGSAGTFLPPGAFGIRRWLVPPYDAGKTAEARAAADQFLVRLSSSTGGRLYVARPDADVPEMLADIGDELSNQLVLGYYPTKDTLDGTFRRIRVTVDCADCTVRARTGYRAGAR